MNPKMSVYDLMFVYFQHFTVQAPTQEQMESVNHAFQTLLNQGYVSEELYQGLSKAYQSSTNSIDVATFFKRVPKKRFNLLKESGFFYHNELRLTSAAPEVKYDYDTGELIRISAPYFLEMRASYSLEDMMAYFKTKPHCYEPMVMADVRLKGSFKWLCETYEPEIVLFMIDAAESALASDQLKSLKNPSNLHEFYAEAKLARERKETECKQGGGANVVLKKRMLHY